MSGRSRPLALAIGVLFGASVISCSLLGDESSTCDVSEGQETFEAAGVDTDDLTIVEGCTEVFEGLREGELRTAVATGDQAAVESALRKGSIDLSSVSSSPFEAIEVPPSFDVLVTPPGQEWSEGERLIHRDQVDYRGRAWDRYVEWGRQRDGERYMVAVVLETGSM